MMKKNRRNFIKKSSTAMIGISVLPNVLLSKSLVSPNEVVRMGVIGANGMGWSDMRSHLRMDDIECIAICDVDQSVLDRRKKEYGNYRENNPRRVLSFHP